MKKKIIKTKKNNKLNLTKKKFYKKKYLNNNNKSTCKKKLFKKNNKTKKQLGGDTELEKLKKIEYFRTRFRDRVVSILNNVKNSEIIKNSVQSIIMLFLKNYTQKGDKTFTNNYDINTLIPVSNKGYPINNVDTAKNKTDIYDFVSPLIVIFDNLSGKISNKQMISILNSYRISGGNFSLVSEKYTITPIENEIQKKRINNVKLLLKYYFVIKDLLKPEIVTQINDLLTPVPVANAAIPVSNAAIPVSPVAPSIPVAPVIPDTPAIPDISVATDVPDVSAIPDAPAIPDVPDAAVESDKTIIQLDSPPETMEEIQEVKQIDMILPTQPSLIKPIDFTLPVPDDVDIGYSTIESVSNFWGPLFSEDELKQLKTNFKTFYANDGGNVSYTLCKTLTSYLSAYKIPEITYSNVQFETDVIFLNCLITFLYAFILYKLFDTKQDYIFIFKGGRALQICLGRDNEVKIENYFSEDTDILIVPNFYLKDRVVERDIIKIKNFSEHICFLVKWMVPESINIIVSKSSTTFNRNETITKLIYFFKPKIPIYRAANAGSAHKALSDIGFGEIDTKLKPYFSDFDGVYLFVKHPFEQMMLFVYQTELNMIGEKLYLYLYYFITKYRIERRGNKQLNTQDIETIKECDFFIKKFKKSIIKLLELLITKRYPDGFNKPDGSLNSIKKRNAYKILLSELFDNFKDDYNIDEKVMVLNSLLPPP